MKTRFTIAAALLMSVAWIGSSPASAYVRSTSPVIVTVTCSLANDNIYIEWSKDAGKPIKASIQGTLNTLAFGVTLTIPGSRGKHGNWTVTPTELRSDVGTDLTSGSVRVRLYNRDYSVQSDSYPVGNGYLTCA